MGAGTQRGLVRALEDVVGDTLRVVAEYDRTGYNLLFMRESLERRVENRAEEVHQELVLQGIDRSHLEDLFGAGDLDCTMHRFDDMMAFHFSRTEYSGVFVSIDSAASVDLDALSETVRSFME